ncbi:MAG: DUF4010 domain-containing protein [Pseudomonadota bacterium]
MDEELAGLIPRMALALGLGLLIGLERGWRTRDATPGSRTAGVRTFAITGLLGGIVGALARGGGAEIALPGSVLIGLAFIAYAGVIALFGREENRAAGVFSATTTIAGLLTFMLGVYSLIGNLHLAAAAGVATAGVLILREELHAWVRKMAPSDLQSVLVLLAMSFIALPVMPDRAIGPWGGLNPRQIWLIAIVLASVSFAGFVAVKALGEKRGVLLSAAIGGLVSSTAVMFANARAAAAVPGNSRLLAAGSALATAISFLRVTVIVAVLAPSLSGAVAPPLLIGALTAVAFAFATGREKTAAHPASAQTSFRNPFGFLSVVGLAVLMGAMMLLLRLVNEQFGSHGTAAGAALAGALDVDAMTVSISQLVPLRLDVYSAAQAILAGVASNTLVKTVFAAIVGRGRFSFAVCVMSFTCFATAAIAHVLSRALLA